MKEEIKYELSELGSSLAGQRVVMPYSAPDGYFDGLSGRLNSCIADEFEQDNGLGLSKELPYRAPEGYFDALPGRILEKAGRSKQRGFAITFRQLRWAAAAVLVVAIGLGAVNLMQEGNATMTKDGLLANVGDKEIREYLVSIYHAPAKGATGSAYLEGIDVDTRDIVAYLDETGWNLD